MLLHVVFCDIYMDLCQVFSLFVRPGWSWLDLDGRASGVAALALGVDGPASSLSIKNLQFLSCGAFPRVHTQRGIRITK